MQHAQQPRSSPGVMTRRHVPCVLTALLPGARTGASSKTLGSVFGRNLLAAAQPNLNHELYANWHEPSTSATACYLLTRTVRGWQELPWATTGAAGPSGGYRLVPPHAWVTTYEHALASIQRLVTIWPPARLCTPGAAMQERMQVQDKLRTQCKAEVAASLSSACCIITHVGPVQSEGARGGMLIPAAQIVTMLAHIAELLGWLQRRLADTGCGGGEWDEWRAALLRFKTCGALTDVRLTTFRVSSAQTDSSV
jgi:hypothetical protein